ncbi:hypothetical protein RRG08_016152 [Elysia crispata]|uniref:Uncharacterized protein n=1 Tax=Elysia crispata TaxID=231223 RepID=A0AAE0Z2Y5_9GAST|nr:hypothetical protein RRG08_016152 [Elysia crispata]
MSPKITGEGKDMDFILMARHCLAELGSNVTGIFIAVLAREVDNNRGLTQAFVYGALEDFSVYRLGHAYFKLQPLFTGPIIIVSLAAPCLISADCLEPRGNPTVPSVSPASILFDYQRHLPRAHFRY